MVQERWRYMGLVRGLYHKVLTNGVRYGIIDNVRGGFPHGAMVPKIVREVARC